MNLLRKINYLCIALLCCTLLTTGCSDDEIVRSGDGTAGYLKLRITSSKIASRAVTMDGLSKAKKVEVSLLYNDMPITQTLNLSSVAGATDLGLESENLEILSGEYQLMSYTLFSDVKPGLEVPERLATIYPDDNIIFRVSNGHITEVDLKVKATVRGNVYFELKKDLSNYQEEMDKVQSSTRAAITIPDEYFNYGDIESVALFYKRKGTSEYATPHIFKIYEKSGEKYLHTDTLNLEVGEYELTSYMLYSDKTQGTLILAGDLKETYITVAPAICTKSSFDVKYPKNMNSFKDYVALYNIWHKMNGSEWSYTGESFPNGANWRFYNRSIEEWGNQPGVELDGSGRVKTLDIGAFNPAGPVPDELGELTELTGLWLGTHNDVVDPLNDGTEPYTLNKYELRRQGVDLRAHRMAIEKERLSLLHPVKASNIYEPKKKTTYKYAKPKTYDVGQGTLTNRITSIPKTINKLTKLEYLFVANGLIGLNENDIPEELAELKMLTDVEFYNCRFKKFPEAIKKMTSVVSMNFSNNTTMDPDDLYEGLNEFIGSSKGALQILYVTSCGLEKFPENLAIAEKVGLLDMTTNKLKALPSTNRKLAPVQAFFDDNQIATIADEFCETDDIEKFSISNNLLTEFPGLFKDGSKSDYTASSVDFSNNHITRFSDTFDGICVETLTLSVNPLGQETATSKGKKMCPTILAEKESKISHLVLSGCEIDSVSLDALKGLNRMLEAVDLSSNNLQYMPKEMGIESLPILSGLNLSYNCFAEFPIDALKLGMLNKFYLSNQNAVKKDRKGIPYKDIDGGNLTYRCLRTWPSSIGGYPAYATLRLLDVSGNDIIKIEENDYPSLLSSFNVSDNDNLEMYIPSEVCSKIAAGKVELGFSSNQYIYGCPILDLDMND